MKTLSFKIFTILAGLAILVAKPSVVQKISHRENFVRTQPAAADAIHELVFAIRQKNLVELDRVAIERSTPENPLYQNWLTFEEVGALISNHVATQTVTGWLAENNVPVTWTSGHSEYIKASAKVSTWESLLNTKFHVFEDRAQPANADGAYPTVVRTTEYSLPEHMIPHLSTVFNTVQAPPVTAAARLAATRKQIESATPAAASASAKKHVETQGVVTVDFLNSLYNIASNTGNVDMQQVIYEYRENFYYSPDDLTQFQQTYNLPVQAAEHPTGYNTSDCVAETCSWSNLEVQYLMGVAQQTTTVYKHVSLTDPVSSWIVNAPDGNPPEVNVFPWSYDQQSLSADVLSAFNTEALKLTSMGVTLIAESGDGGAAGDAAHCTQDSSSSTFTYWTGDAWIGVGYFPQFPAACPYVTTVGGTMGQESGGVQLACQSQLGGVVTSGGGFSAYDYTPSWQIGAVNSYFNSLNTGTYPTEGYNGAGRAYPDVSLISVWYEAIVAGSTLNLFTTGASSTVFAAMVSLVNAARATAGKPTIGFMNPTLYASSSASRFQDVTSGYNKCMPTNDASSATCCASGFYAAVGWDPVTGFGSVDYPTLLSMFDYAPSAMPTRRPTSKPTTKPTAAPSDAKIPTRKPSRAPTMTPTSGSSTAPTVSPTVTEPPTAVPSVPPTATPSAIPSAVPSAVPSEMPSAIPSTDPTAIPSAVPSAVPTDAPSALPSAVPSAVPTSDPTFPPSTVPSAVPSSLPTVAPSAAPSTILTNSPTTAPSAFPSAMQTEEPSQTPSAVPSVVPSPAPSAVPTADPSAAPSAVPSAVPSTAPTRVPTEQPTDSPTPAPSNLPTMTPTKAPTGAPSLLATAGPSAIPTVMPSPAPTFAPSRKPTKEPTPIPSKLTSVAPTFTPSLRPTAQRKCRRSIWDPVTGKCKHTRQPTRSPTVKPPSVPSRKPTKAPKGSPSRQPSRAPTAKPSKAPTRAPSRLPTRAPTSKPTRVPTRAPSRLPTRAPTRTPTRVPTKAPSRLPTRAPSNKPTRVPTKAPSRKPSRMPTNKPVKSSVIAPSPDTDNLLTNQQHGGSGAEEQTAGESSSQSVGRTMAIVAMVAAAVGVVVMLAYYVFHSAHTIFHATDGTHSSQEGASAV